MALDIHDVLKKVESNEKKLEVHAKSLYDMEKTVGKFSDSAPSNFVDKNSCLAKHEKLDVALDGCKSFLHDVDKRQSVLESTFKQFLTISAEERKLIDENQKYLKSVITEMMKRDKDFTLKLFGIITGGSTAIFTIGTLIVKYIIGG